jgi:glycosyltransferase involved in cell wall biosynthesis
MNPMVQVALVSEHASPLATLGGDDAGGQNVHVAALARALARRGCRVDVHTRRDDPSLPTTVALAPGVIIDHVDAGPPQPIPKDELLPHMDAFAAALDTRWTRRRPDVVHAHFWMSGQAALAAARPRGIPVAQTFHALGTVKHRHQGADDTSPPGRVAAERDLARQVDAVVATCRDERAELVALGADPARIEVVPCGIDPAVFAPHGPAEARPASPSDRPLRIVAVGRLVARKGVDDAIRALAGVPGAELVVVGGPPAEALATDTEALRLRGVARTAGVADRVVFRGQLGHGEVARVLRSADIALAAPWYEPFGIVPLEAMACGLPVVGTAVGGLLDSVVHGVTGLLVPPRDPAALAAALHTLARDPGRRRRMGRAGARRARARYDWATVAARTLAVYEQLVAAAAPTTSPRPAPTDPRPAPTAASTAVSA